MSCIYMPVAEFVLEKKGIQACVLLSRFAKICYTDFHPAVCNTGFLRLVQFHTIFTLDK